MDAYSPGPQGDDRLGTGIDWSKWIRRFIIGIVLIFAILAGFGIGSRAGAQAPVLELDRVDIGHTGVELCLATVQAGNVDGIYWAIGYDGIWFPPAWGGLPWRQVPRYCWTVQPSAHTTERAVWVASNRAPGAGGQSFDMVIRRTMAPGRVFVP